jgi:hypothetical protein
MGCGAVGRWWFGFDKYRASSGKAVLEHAGHRSGEPLRHPIARRSLLRKCYDFCPCYGVCASIRSRASEAGRGPRSDCVCFRDCARMGGGDALDAAQSYAKSVWVRCGCGAHHFAASLWDCGAQTGSGLEQSWLVVLAFVAGYINCAHARLELPRSPSGVKSWITR